MKHATFVLLGLLLSSVQCYPVQPAHAGEADYLAQAQLKEARAHTAELKNIRRALERMEAGCK